MICDDVIICYLPKGVKAKCYQHNYEGILSSDLNTSKFVLL